MIVQTSFVLFLSHQHETDRERQTDIQTDGQTDVKQSQVHKDQTSSIHTTRILLSESYLRTLAYVAYVDISKMQTIYLMQDSYCLLVNSYRKFIYLFYLFNTFGAPSTYKIKATIKSSRTPRQSQDIKNAANVTPQHKHTEKHRVQNELKLKSILQIPRHDISK